MELCLWMIHPGTKCSVSVRADVGVTVTEDNKRNEKQTELITNNEVTSTCILNWNTYWADPRPCEKSFTKTPYHPLYIHIVGPSLTVNDSTQWDRLHSRILRSFDVKSCYVWPEHFTSCICKLITTNLNLYFFGMVLETEVIDGVSQW